MLLPHHKFRSLKLVLVGALIGPISIVTGFSPNQIQPASAAPGDGITAYVSPPFVQGPPSSYSATIETFNSWSSCGSFPASSVGTFSGTCTLDNGATSVWGGATTTSDTPTVGGSPSKYISAPSSGNFTLTFDASTPAKYVGFWWSAGSAGNTVKIYTSASGATPAATFTTTTINTILGSSAPSPYPGSATVTALDGSTYRKGYYFGRPAQHSSTSPTSITGFSNSESHAFLSIFASGSISFTKIEFTGGGFEFDNVAISTTTQTPTQNLVFIESVLGKTVTFMANGGTGTMAAQIDSAAANLTANSFTRAGYTFAGWHTNSSGSGGTSYANQASYNFASDLTLHAKWTPDPLTVTYNSQGGSPIANGSTTTGASIAASPGTPTQAGYNFLGWFTAPTGGTAITFPYPHGQTANFTLHAQWSSNPPSTTAPSVSPAPASATSTTVAEAPATPTPTISAPKKIRTGTVITVVARGFAPGESVEMSVGENGKTRSVVADSNGEVRLTVKLTTTDDGERVVARASAGSKKASQEIEINDPIKALPNTGQNLLFIFSLGLMLLMIGLALTLRRRPVY